MANIGINELLQEAVKTGSGIANQEIELGSATSVIDLKQPTSGGRVEADMSILPKKKDKQDVEVKKPIEQEVFAPGGPFEEYLSEKAENLAKLNESIDLHNQAVAEALGEEVPEEITDKDVIRSKKANLDLEKTEAEEYVEPTEEEYVDELEREDEELVVTAPLPLKNKKITSIPTKDEEEPDVTPESLSAVKAPPTVNPAAVSFDIDEDDLDELEEDVAQEDTDETLENLKAEITTKINPVSKALNITGFTRVQKGVRASAVVESIEKASADWVLMSSGSKITMSAFSGTDIDSLNGSAGGSAATILNKRYKIFYDHLISDNKPESVEAWVKSLSYLDNDALFMCAYIASFRDANYLPRDCEKCKNAFLTDNLPLEEMYELPDEAKSRFNKIMSGEYGYTSDLYVSEVVPISDSIAIAFREPSVYSVLFEPAYLNEEFTRKYNDIMSVLSYIDELCYVDVENRQLIPIAYKRYPTNKVKDTKSRIIEYAKIIKSLTPDQYSVIVAYINAINTRKNISITYHIPETVCPKCGAIIPAQTLRGEDLLFTRHQLAVLATTSIK